jgi:hypothetical protein
VDKNITLKLDEHILKRVKHIAVDQNTSVSAWVSDLIVRQLRDQDLYEESRLAALAALSTGYRLGGKPLLRGELHDRR